MAEQLQSLSMAGGAAGEGGRASEGVPASRQAGSTVLARWTEFAGAFLLYFVCIPPSPQVGHIVTRLDVLTPFKAVVESCPTWAQIPCISSCNGCGTSCSLLLLYYLALLEIASRCPPIRPGCKCSKRLRLHKQQIQVGEQWPAYSCKYTE